MPLVHCPACTQPARVQGTAGECFSCRHQWILTPAVEPVKHSRYWQIAMIGCAGVAIVLAVTVPMLNKVKQPDPIPRVVSDPVIETQSRADGSYLAFRRAMQIWIREARGATTLLCTAPSLPIYHRRIRESVDKLAAARDTTTDQSDASDARATILKLAETTQSSLGDCEEMVELHMLAVRSVEPATASYLGIMLDLVGRAHDELLDTIDDAIKSTAPPGGAALDAVKAQFKTILDALANALRKARPD